MDKTKLVSQVSNLFRITGHRVNVSITINHREIDIRAEETQGLVRKVILIECADHDRPVGVQKLQEDFQKLSAAKEQMKDNAIIMHVSALGYSPDAQGYAVDRGVSIHSLQDLTANLINFDGYVEAVRSEPVRPIILREYQENGIYSEGNHKSKLPSLNFFKRWLSSQESWLTLLGDYGVGKSWTLKRLLYELIDEYATDPTNHPLPFFIPLQKFTKAFDFQNLIIRTFQNYGLTGVHYSAFEHLMFQGKIIFILDSFDEMAQHLSKNSIRENLNELLVGVSHNTKTIMASRANYFEGRAERLLIVDRSGSIEWHPIDQVEYEHQNSLSRQIRANLEKSTFARISDLTIEQRKKLFKIVLEDDQRSYAILIDLLERFQNLENMSQRAVIARLLTTVAETLASDRKVESFAGGPLIPDDLSDLNEAKIFEVVVHNLIERDSGIGPLTAYKRQKFLRAFALFLQRRAGETFASPSEIREVVEELFKEDLHRTDVPEQMLESMYRTCRRHSGLTTEGQFRDTTGVIDLPVDEDDVDSRVGFSHNSLREYLVAEAFAEFIENRTSYSYLLEAVITDVVGSLFAGICAHRRGIYDKLRAFYKEAMDDRVREILFGFIYRLIRSGGERFTNLLGSPPVISGADVSAMDLSGLPLRNIRVINCLVQDTDFRKSDLRGSDFEGSILEGAMLDEVLIENADFRLAEVESLYVYDEYDTSTTAIIKGKRARQWLFSRGALVSPNDDLNPLMGKPWYEAAREVTKTLEGRMAGTHQDISLAKGTRNENRQFAQDFVSFLVRKRILLVVVKSDRSSGNVVRVNPKKRDIIREFSNDGIIAEELRPFFRKFLKDWDHIFN